MITSSAPSARLAGRAAKLGGAHTEPPAFEEPPADPSLEHLDPLGHRRLRELQRIRGAMNAPGFQRRSERGQLAAASGLATDSGLDISETWHSEQESISVRWH